MADKTTIKVGNAISMIEKAVELDMKHRYTEALAYYHEGINILLSKNVMAEVKTIETRNKIERCITRMEEIQNFLDKEKAAGSYHEQIIIEENSTGHSYQSIFGRFLNSEVTTISITDPYVRKFYQCQNLLRFCEISVKKCENLKSISLATTSETTTTNNQITYLNEIKRDLEAHYKISFDIKISASLHDREIRLDNGWIIKIGRGLDYFQCPDSAFSLGTFDFDLRKCRETTVDIFHVKSVLKSYG